MSKHKFKLVKTFEYEDFKKDTNGRVFVFDLMPLVVLNKDGIVSFVVRDNDDTINRWLIGHGALIGETVYVRTRKKD